MRKLILIAFAVVALLLGSCKKEPQTLAKIECHAGGINPHAYVDNEEILLDTQYKVKRGSFIRVHCGDTSMVSSVWIISDGVVVDKHTNKCFIQLTYRVE